MDEDNTVLDSYTFTMSEGESRVVEPAAPEGYELTDGEAVTVTLSANGTLSRDQVVFHCALITV